MITVTSTAQYALLKLKEAGTEQKRQGASASTITPRSKRTKEKRQAVIRACLTVRLKALDTLPSFTFLSLLCLSYCQHMEKRSARYPRDPQVDSTRS